MLSQEKRILLPQDLEPVKTLEEYKAICGLAGLRKACGLTPQQTIIQAFPEYFNEATASFVYEKKHPVVLARPRAWPKDRFQQ
ncbi:MAG: hypothetical protein HZC18_05600 [Candidatus Omnitrophica bacterium]|nr:hypothetical protein [Candidatus Omnitrophota bacterium]